QKFYDGLLTGEINLPKVKKPYNPSSIRRIHNVISSSLTAAVQWQLIEDNPCRRVKPPKTKRSSDIKCFNLEEAQIFLQYITEPYTVPHGGRGEYGTVAADIRTESLQLITLFNLALYGGFRRGELLALTWEDIDFHHRTITVNKSLAKTKAGFLVKSTKNEASKRVVAVPAECITLLKRLNLQQKEQRMKFGSAWEGKNNVFSQTMGGYMDTNTPNHSFQRIIKRYNQTHEDQLPLISFHGLRHTSATLLIAQNNDIKTVSARLGHADVSTTLNIYSHALKERDEKAADSLSILFKQQA
ncbi:MAG: site-specific integrase, partial [Firmicutes bacterium]|nr:site-specific integrase [Bacillota bacterium]